jgi:hypothetical protein
VGCGVEDDQLVAPALEDLRRSEVPIHDSICDN